MLIFPMNSLKALNLFYLLLLLIPSIGNSQTTQQTISSQGFTGKTKKNLLVTQSVGQLSVIGNLNLNSNNLLNQGFQKPNWNTLVASSSNNLTINITPNPFKDWIYLNVNGKVTHDLNCQVFDIAGRLIKTFKIPKVQINSPIDLSRLEDASYLLIFEHNNEFYYKILLKI